jgi:serine/threonine protein kinase
MEGTELEGKKGIYQLTESLGAGGFGQAWRATVANVKSTGRWLVDPGPQKGATVVVKWPNLQDQYSAAENAAFLQDVNRTINSELSALKRLADLSCVARIYDMGLLGVTLDDDSPQGAIFLVEEYLPGERLDEHLTGKFGDSTLAFSGIGDSDRFLDYAIRLASAVRDIHHRGVIHGDIWERNIVSAPTGELRLFDFGAAAIRDTAFLRPDSLAARRSDSRVAPERRRGERHGRRSDIYSLGGLFFYMATGQDPPQPIADNDDLKSTVVMLINSLNPSLLSSNCSIADIIARCLRYDKDQRTRDADSLLNELRLFGFVETQGRGEGSKTRDCVGCLLDGRLSPDSLFARMLRMDGAYLESRADDMKRGILEISGDHEVLVIGMSAYLSVLRRGDRFICRTTPRFWTPKNMGISGRFLSMLRLVAQKGVIVRHLMLVCEQDRDDPVTRRILTEHAAVARQLGSTDSNLGFYCRTVSGDERRRLVKETDWETSYEVSEDEVKAVQPVFDRDNVLRTLRFVREKPTTAARRIAAMDADLIGAATVDVWLREGAESLPTRNRE